MKLSEVHTHIYRGVAGCEVDWFFTAAMLRSAATTLFDQMSSKERVNTFPEGNWIRASPFGGPLGPYLMLCAFSLENLIKGILIRDDPSLVVVVIVEG